MEDSVAKGGRLLHLSGIYSLYPPCFLFHFQGRKNTQCREKDNH